MSGRQLLDPHIWLWVLADSPSLPRDLRARMEAPGFPGRLPGVGSAARLNDAAPSGCM